MKPNSFRSQRGGARGGSSSRRGQALVEFALVMPLLLIFLMGIIEFGRAWNQHQIVTDAAREGARKAAVVAGANYRDSALAAVDTSLAAGGIDPDSADVTVSPPANALSGDPVSVEIRLPYRFTFTGAIIELVTLRTWDLKNITLTTRFVMRKE